MLCFYDKTDQQMLFQLERYISRTLARCLNSNRQARTAPLCQNDVELLLSIHRFDFEFDRLAKQFLQTCERIRLLI